MESCLITGNTSVGGNAVAIAGFNSGAEHCVVSNNIGDGVHAFYSSKVGGFTCIGNSGWGMTAFYPAGVKVSDCSFLGNGLGGVRLSTQFFAGHGLKHCTFAGGDGLTATMLEVTDETLIEGCTFDGGKVAAPSGGNIVFLDSIAFSPSIVPGTNVETNYSDVTGYAAFGIGNIDANPKWVNAAAHDYRLQPGSPCIDTGSPASPPDLDLSRADMGAYPFAAWDDVGGNLPFGPGLPEPSLAAQGQLVAGHSIGIALSHMQQFQPTILIVGISALDAGFKGGTLWPSPDLVIPGLVTGGSGGFSLATTWPASVPTGFSIWAQSWAPDSGVPQGFCASNGVHATAP
jgi:hypothetical protein